MRLIRGEAVGNQAWLAPRKSRFPNPPDQVVLYAPSRYGSFKQPILSQGDQGTDRARCRAPRSHNSSKHGRMAMLDPLQSSLQHLTIHTIHGASPRSTGIRIALSVYLCKLRVTARDACAESEIFDESVTTVTPPPLTAWSARPRCADRKSQEKARRSDRITSDNREGGTPTCRSAKSSQLFFV